MIANGISLSDASSSIYGSSRHALFFVSRSLHTKTSFLHFAVSCEMCYFLPFDKIPGTVVSGVLQRTTVCAIHTSYIAGSDFAARLDDDASWNKKDCGSTVGGTMTLETRTTTLHFLPLVSETSDTQEAKTCIPVGVQFSLSEFGSLERNVDVSMV